MKMASAKIKHQYIQCFGITVLILALVRCVFPGVANNEGSDDTSSSDTVATEQETAALWKQWSSGKKSSESVVATVDHKDTQREVRRRIPLITVGDYDAAFPDSNHVQLVAAQRWGVGPVKNRADAEQRKDEVVYMGLSPYYEVAKLDASIPYLVPRAAVLLEDIGRNFLDSLQAKGIPLCRMVVSSVLRSEEDIARLRRKNKNATEQSCHLYGTTFDIRYDLFAPVTSRSNVQCAELKRVLGYVLSDLRLQDRCYVKYEKLQPCFHITVR